METTVNGTKMYYEVHGPEKAPPIVLIHGFPFSSAMWTPQIEALKSQWRVIVYDIRGHGRSEAGDSQYLIEFFVEDLLALLDHLQIPKAIFCGLSMGGYIALRLVERNPERVRALVLADTRSEGDSNEGKIKRANAMKVIAKDPAVFVDGFMKSVFTANSLNTHPPYTKKIQEIMLETNPAAMRGTLLALAARMDMTAFLPSIKVPTLILVGEEDPITPPSAAESMQARIAGSRLVKLSGASHLSNLENTSAFNNALQDFLKGLLS